VSPPSQTRLALSGLLWLVFVGWRAGDSLGELGREAVATGTRLRSVDLRTPGDQRIRRAFGEHAAIFDLLAAEVPASDVIVWVPRVASASAIDELLGAWNALLYPRRIVPVEPADPRLRAIAPGDCALLLGPASPDGLGAADGGALRRAGAAEAATLLRAP